MSTGIFSVVLQIIGKTLKKIVVFPVLMWCVLSKLMQDEKDSSLYCFPYVRKMQPLWKDMMLSKFSNYSHLCICMYSIRDAERL